ncbi:COR domain-containing protein [Nostoc sp. UHCC 0870]|uniref:COR domain-containing protein n=1 Tax=Nostoc sp. UHCC 0870 TaxID=2914041 RepID=UPI001EDDBD42|nr:COR domain-containing protein [Nostoc sp. UHCC 0870]UKO97556.1 leucine-rich repeat domain-containing protein [Nostoc sp. UHCC 0870]
MTNEELLHLIEQANRDKVTELNLSGQRLKTLPPEIGQLTNLQTLYLSSNQLSSLPPEFGQLTNLQSLHLGGNQLSSLPPEIGQLTNLQSLHLGGNQLSSLPPEIGQLTNLQSLHLGGNQLSSLPPEIGQLTNLQTLNLGNNQLSSLPPEIGQLTNLESLDLDDNELSSLPPEIGQLTNLQSLDLRRNQLSSLPPEFGQLTNLQMLYLGSNQLSSLPPEFGQLKNLKILDIQDNNLINLPSEIQLLTKLQKLDLRGEGNANLQIPPEILGDSWIKLGNPTKIISYYFSLAAEQEKPLNEAKVLLVGQGSVGKTSLLKRLIHDLYDPHENKTEGINIQNWQVTLNDQPIRLNVWDFGGQEIMHATHQFFLTKRSLYLLVLDARVDERQNELEYWLKIIHSFGDNSPIIIVGNKIDQHPLDIDQKGLRDKYTNIKDIVSISCATGSGVAELRSIITRELANIQHIHDPLPKSWFQVKTRLEAMKDENIDYISYKKYEDLCNEEQVTGDRNQSTLIELLHRLGIVLNFRDDDRLEDTNVLNPTWVTNGVYKILNDNQLITQWRGMLDRQQLNRILNDPCYPRNKQVFIVDMMQKFELCFPLENGTGDSRFLIPDLLPKEEPATGEWENVLAFQYHYNVLPSSIISRFIVRMHHLADKQTWWRSGVVLKHRHNRALVKSDREDQKIFISISGTNSTRRELLAMIRSQFEAIHQTIKGLIADEKVPIPGHPKIIADYENLLSYEEKGLPYIPPGLTETFDPRQILDGIESPAQRQERQRDRQEKPNMIRLPTSEYEKEIFISYAWGGDSETYVNHLDEVLQSKDITIIRDKRDLGFKGLIKDFMEKIGRGKCVIAVISDKYLKSPNCMFELVQIAKNGNFYDRIFPIVLEDAQIYKPTERIKYIKHWENEIKELNEAMKGVDLANMQGFREDIDLYTEIRHTIAELTNRLKDMNTLTPDIHSESEFEQLLQAIVQRLDYEV